MLLPIHRISHKILLKHHGSSALDLARIPSLIPLLIAEPQKSTAHLERQVEIVGSPARLQQIHPGSGHNLYRLHLQQMMDWITLHVELGQMAWPAMMDYYRLYDLDDLDYDPASAYRIWHRSQHHKNAKNNVYFSPFFVLKNIQVNQAAISDIMDRASSLIEAHSDQFYNFAGRPDATRIRKAVMYVMARDFGWKQADIAQVFSTSQRMVSHHISSLFPPSMTAMS